MILALAVIVALLGMATVGLFLQVQALKRQIDGLPAAAASDPDHEGTAGGRIARLSELRELTSSRDGVTVYFATASCSGCVLLIEQMRGTDVIVCHPAGDSIDLPQGVEGLTLDPASFAALRLPGVPYHSRWERGQLVEARPVVAADIDVLTNDQRLSSEEATHA